MNRKYLFLFGVLAIAIVLSGCINGGDDINATADDGTGGFVTQPPKIFRLLITDSLAGTDDFDSIRVTFNQTRVYGAGFGNDRPTDASLDLLNQTGGLTYLLDEYNLVVGEYTKLEVGVAMVEATIGGEKVNVTVPNDTLPLDLTFNATARETVSVLLDFHVAINSSGDYNLLPLASKSGVIGKDIPSEGIKEWNDLYERYESYDTMQEKREQDWITSKESEGEATL